MAVVIIGGKELFTSRKKKLLRFSWIFSIIFYEILKIVIRERDGKQQLLFLCTKVNDGERARRCESQSSWRGDVNKNLITMI